MENTEFASSCLHPFINLGDWASVGAEGREESIHSLQVSYGKGFFGLNLL